MYVKKRNGKRERVMFDKITARINSLCYGLDSSISAHKVTSKVVQGIFDGVTTVHLDNLAAETTASMTASHPDYAKLASRIAISNLHKTTEKYFSKTIEKLYNYINPKTDKKSPLVSKSLYETVKKNADLIDSSIIRSRDFNLDYFGYKTLEKSYLLKIGGEVAETPQHLFMRVSLGIHGQDVEAAVATYDYMSKGYFIHSTPTLFNSGTTFPQLSSCFLLAMREDSILGIFDTLKQCSLISKSAGGIGFSAHNIRSAGSYIATTNGVSNGLVPMLRVFNETARYVDQGGGKRKGAFAVYLEPWHSDILEFLDLKKNFGKEEMRARDLFYGLWIPDLFMKRVEADADWTLMCPNECPDLYTTYGEEFEELYKKYESENRGRSTIKARKLWFKILESQIETGTPYMLYKDSINKKSNQKNVGVIRSSNLCTEIVEYTDKNEVAVCNLASISLPMFVNKSGFNHKKLYEVTRVIVRNLNKVIDVNYYPVKEAKASNLRHRPIGIGVQGLADAFILLRLPFTSEEAKKLNKEVFETIYYGAVIESVEEAIKYGAYETYEGSPISQGEFQYNLWGLKDEDLSGRWNWGKLRDKVKKYGIRNSLLVAPMPTASTSQILGNNECFEPYTTNLYTRRVLSGEFIVINKHLVKDLIKIGMWDEDMKQELMVSNGSIQHIPGIPTKLKELYKTVWELKMRDILDMARDRSYFIDQSQSLNLFMEDPTEKKLTSMHFYAWKLGLKTGMYYLRTKAAVDPTKFTVDITKKEVEKVKFEQGDCEMCGS